MAQTGPYNSSPHLDIRRMVKDNHTQTLAMFHLLASSLQVEEHILLQEVLKLGPQGRRLAGHAQMERDKIMALTLEWQRSDGNDDQTRDEYFEDLMAFRRVPIVRKDLRSKGFTMRVYAFLTPHHVLSSHRRATSNCPY